MHSEPPIDRPTPLHGLAAEQLLAAVPAPAWVVAPDWSVLAGNGPAAKQLGCEPAALVGHRLLERLPAGDGRPLSAWPEVSAEPGFMAPLRRPGGGILTLRVQVAPLAGDTGGRLLVTAVPVASSPLPARERRSEDELLRDAKRESLELLAGGVAHDFNNLLTALLGNLSLARMDTGLSSEVQEWLAEAEKATGRARDLTQQLLTFAKGGEPVRRLVELGSCLRESALFARQGSRVRCEFAIAPELWPAEVDVGQIGQVVHNLVLNAVQAMARGGIVTVAAHNVHRDVAHQLGLGAHHYVVIEVRDQGPGIAPTDMARIFQPYFTTKRTGSGLGLATSQAIARRHFGALRVESVPGRGAVFLLYLPAQPGAPVARVEPEPALPKLCGRVLFMDDEPAIRQMAPSLLRRLGFETELAADGHEALEAYRSAFDAGQRFDVVILDLTVPAGMGGLEAVQRLRLLDPSALVLVSSGYAGDPVLLDFAKHGFCGTVTKPYCLAELAAVLGRVLESQPKRASGSA